jgi:hypothetical protein
MNNPALYTDPSGLWSPEIEFDLRGPGQVFNWRAANAFRRDCTDAVNKEGILYHYGCDAIALTTFLNLFNREIVTVGAEVFTTLKRGEMSDQLKRHEACHVGQYDRDDGLFIFRYASDRAGYELQAELMGEVTTSLTTTRLLCRQGMALT